MMMRGPGCTSKANKKVSQSVITRIQTRDDRPRREISGSCCPVQTSSKFKLVRFIRQKSFPMCAEAGGGGEGDKKGDNYSSSASASASALRFLASDDAAGAPSPLPLAAAAAASAAERSL